ncbi:hypothetical protein ACH5RR_014153 [Cinchona calisaya]|uniref:histone acetyltransferase n=1 Tax=Cinchona calisaya TaxID=153742 RepID=A0ABD3A236_9GENT
MGTRCQNLFTFKGCHSNPDMLSTQFQNLNPNQAFDAQPLDQASSFFQSSETAAPGLGWMPGFHDLCSQFGGLDDLVAAGMGHSMPGTGYVDHHYLPRVCSFSNPGVTSRFIASDGNNMISHVGKIPISPEVITSPEQISSITACSDVELYSDAEYCNGGATVPGISLSYLSQSSLENFIPVQQVNQGKLDSIDQRLLETSQNVDNEVLTMSAVENVELLGPVFERIPQGSNSLTSQIAGNVMSGHEDLLQYQLSKALLRKSQWDNYTPKERSMELNQFAVEQEHHIQQKQMHTLQQVGASNVADSKNSLIQDVLLRYILYINDLQNKGKTKDTFLKKLHDMQCQDKQCKCVRIRNLICHYENCSFHLCGICKPIRELCSADTFQSGLGNLRSDPLKAIHDRESSDSGASVNENATPPLKRMRMEDHHLSDNVSSAQAADSADESFRSEGTSQCKKWSEGPLCNKENEEVTKMEHLCTPEDSTQEPKRKKLYSPEDSYRALVTSNHTPENNHKVAHSYAPFLRGELICGTSNSDGLNSDTLPVIEQPNFVQEKGEIDSMSKPKQPESKAKADSREAATDHQAGTNLQDPKKLPVSLVDFLSSMQIKEHIYSLSQSTVEQAIATKSKENLGENTCQLCNMEKLVFSPTPLYCSSCNLRIKHNLIYYWALDEMGSRHCFCTKCFKVSRGGSISLQQGVSFSKALLQKERNNEENEESWVQCDKCGCWQHQICGLYNAERDKEGKAAYICPYCRLKEMEIGDHVPLPAPFGAKELPRTKLSDHIEQRLFRQLKREREERAKFLGKDFDEVPGAAELVVRVVLSVKKLLQVKQQFLDIFPEENYPEEFPYNSKVILLFQKIEGVDVCIFVMYVQEFGSECGYPNQRCIYISYLDSVKYFRPEIETVSGEALRTFVYQEILISYLDYCKKRGFATCYIWACPPIKGDDYILYCHPETQKTPKPEKLRQWYKSMLKKAVQEDIVADYTTLYDRFFIPNGECSTKITASRLPYFDGDYWSGAAEDMIRDMGNPKGKSQGKIKSLTKRTLKAMGLSNLTVDATKDILVMQKLGHAILPAKENFLVVYLLFTCKNCHNLILSGAHWFCNQCKKFYLCSRCVKMEQTLNETKTHTSSGGEKHLLSQVVVNDIPADTAESDVILDNDVFENRHSFLSFCRRNHYQFNTLRRAKHSSMMILCDLHKQMLVTMATTCSRCFKDIMGEAGWHCVSCPSFDICITCYNKSGEGCHNHKLVRHLNENQARQKKAFQVVVLNALYHASQCHATGSNPCSYPLCVKVKKLFHHSSQCKIQQAGGCQFCGKVWFMIHTHSRACQDSRCPVPRCMDIKEHAEMVRGSKISTEGPQSKV